MDLITYEALYEILRNEKFNDELQKISPEFYNQTIRYLNEKKAILEAQQNKTDIFSTTELKKTRKQLENINRILTELYEIRERKIVELAIYSSRSEEDFTSANITKEESLLFESVKDIFKSFRKDILVNMLEGKLPKISHKKSKELNTSTEKIKKLIRFIKTTPKFMAEDTNIYGPFETEDVANIPNKSADLLIKNDKAEQI